jgi:hypothetical protein
MDARETASEASTSPSNAPGETWNIVGEMLPQEGDRVTLADEVDQYGLRIPRVTYSWCDNDKRLIDHSLKFMTRALPAVDARDI